MQDAPPCEEFKSKHKPLELVNVNVQDAPSCEESASNQQPIELVSDHVQVAPKVSARIADHDAEEVDETQL